MGGYEAGRVQKGSCGLIRMVKARGHFEREVEEVRQRVVARSRPPRRLNGERFLDDLQAASCASLEASLDAFDPDDETRQTVREG